MGKSNIQKIIFKARTRFTKKNYFNILFCDKNFKLVGRLGFLELHKTRPFLLNTLVLSRKMTFETLLNVSQFKARVFFKTFFLRSAYEIFLNKNNVGNLFARWVLIKNKNAYKIF